MKKVIFLFCLLLTMIPMKVSASDIIECGDVSFEIAKNRDDVVITKRGENPFMVTYSYEGYNVYVRDVSCDDDMYTFYGYSHGDDDINYYDTVLFVMDELGQVLYDEVSDYGGNEEITGAVWIDQVLFTLTRVDDLGDRWNDIDPEYDYYVIKTYDSNFDEIDSIQLEDEVIKYDNTDDLLLIYYSYLGPVDLGLDTTLKEYYDTDVFDVKTSYDGVIELAFINTGELNGDTVENGLSITYPGVYSFIYNHQEYDFVVHPVVEGVSHLETYNQSVIPVISGGNFTLNNELYLSGTEISDPGNYTLSITGINGYEQVIQFSITPQVEGVINGHDYKEPFTIIFDGEGYLNNSLVTSPLQIDEEGDYVLRVNGVGGFSDLYQFTLAEEHTGFTAQDIVQKIDIFILVIAIVIGVIIIKKK